VVKSYNENEKDAYPSEKRAAMKKKKSSPGGKEIVYCPSMLGEATSIEVGKESPNHPKAIVKSNAG